MLHLVTGGSGSGKSEYAESVCLSLGGPLLYIATMQVWDEEDRKRVEKHRKMREGKGFATVEKDVDLGRISLSPELRNGTLLLECMSNLLVNELYRTDLSEDRDTPAPTDAVPDGFSSDKGVFSEKDEHCIHRILGGIRRLESECENLVVVTDEIFSDGVTYDEETERYRRILAACNRAIAERADRVTEVVFGIPVPVKS